MHKLKCTGCGDSDHFIQCLRQTRHRAWVNRPIEFIPAAFAWQVHGKGMASAWQVYGQCTATPRQVHGECMATAPQAHDKRQASAWQGCAASAQQVCCNLYIHIYVYIYIETTGTGDHRIFWNARVSLEFRKIRSSENPRSSIPGVPKNPRSILLEFRKIRETLNPKP